jgi:hypothetical protein
MRLQIGFAKVVRITKTSSVTWQPAQIQLQDKEKKLGIKLATEKQEERGVYSGSKHLNPQGSSVHQLAAPPGTSQGRMRRAPSSPAMALLEFLRQQWRMPD